MMYFFKKSPPEKSCGKFITVEVTYWEHIGKKAGLKAEELKQ
jgi:hypothetical protein